MKIKALREERKAIHARMLEVAQKAEAEDRAFTGEEKSSLDAMKADRETLLGRIKDLEDVYAAADPDVVARDVNGNPAARAPGRHDVRPRAAGPTAEQKAHALAAWIAHPRGEYLTDEQEAACRALNFRPDAGAIELRFGSTGASKAAQAAFRCGGRNDGDRAHRAGVDFRAALSNEVPTQGGLLTAPGSMASSLEVNMLAFGGLLQVCDTMTTETGEVITWPTANDVGNKGRRLAVNAAVNLTPDPTYAAVTWGAHGYTSDGILVPYRLLRDSVFDVPEIVGGMLGERLGRIFNDECTNGTGNAMPFGIVTRSAQFAAASSTAIVADDLIRIKKGIDPAYRSMGCSYMMHDQISLQVLLMKDGTGRPLWQDALSQGEPDRYNGDPAYINQSMDSTVASGKNTILYGHMPSYKVRRVGTIRLFRSAELYRITGDQDVFAAFAYLDGNLLTTGTNRMNVLHHT